MAVYRFSGDPFRELAALQDRLNRAFDPPRGQRPGGEELYTGQWVPPVDIYETEGHDLLLKAELPDMAREDIELTVERNTLTLKGTRKRPADVKEDQIRRIERRYGTFSRSFALPTTVDASKVTADYKNGVLTVKLPFREEAKPRQIQVEIAA